MAITWTAPATVVDVHDGDTMHLRLDLHADVDLGWRIQVAVTSAPVVTVRVAHIDAPELRVDGQPNPTGVAARGYAAELLPAAVRVRLTSHSLDKYGRSLGDITLPDGRDFATEMVAAGHAVPYEGGPR